MIIVAMAVRIIVIIICLILIFINISHVLSTNHRNASVGNLFLLIYIALLILMAGGRFV